ncbi:MAG TPA: cation:proton antiporter, partial [Actinomycetota bacterium]|nr:cation:proton antiporter [Actinomycetota bacterium]
MEHPEILVELGAILVGLAILSRLATRTGMPTIPLYLAAGLAFGRGGIVPVVTAEEFVQVGAEIGLILLLFMLGLEYTASELVSTIRTQARIGVLDFVL